MSLSPSTQAALDEGLRRFAAGLYYEAHETWEEAWLVEEGDVKLGLQGLIQLTAAFHKGLRLQNTRAMAKLLDASLERLEFVAPRQPVFGGVDLVSLVEEVKRLRGGDLSSAALTIPRVPTSV